MSDLPWLPEDSVYLDRRDQPISRQDRPVWQGDIFFDVPLAIAGRGAEGARSRPTTVAVLGHPCSIYAGPRMNEVQFVAEVRLLADVVTGQRKLQAPWDSHYYLFPLPGLQGDNDYVIDFRRVGMTHYRNLDERRIACLNLGGWAALQRRWAYHSLRMDLPLSTRIADLIGLWNEVTLWEDWNSRRQDPWAFKAWLDRAQERGQYAGSVRRDLLDFGLDQITADLPAAPQPDPADPAS